MDRGQALWWKDMSYGTSGIYMSQGIATHKLCGAQTFPLAEGI